MSAVTRGLNGVVDFSARRAILARVVSPLREACNSSQWTCPVCTPCVRFAVSVAVSRGGELNIGRTPITLPT
jgi:hypothetical protein